jgi:hypothetical protein
MARSGREMITRSIHWCDSMVNKKAGGVGGDGDGDGASRERRWQHLALWEAMAGASLQ